MHQRILIGEQQEEAEVNMTPMLDIVFIMLIFFIVSTSFVRESGIEIKRPVASTSDTQTKTAVLIALSDREEIWLDRKVVDVRMIRPALERMKTEQADVSVVVQADEASSTGSLVALIDQIRQAGVPYTVATKSK
ncbi:MULTISPECIES: biopolymer transporter ExbD [unclassified Oleiphilus]|uniref:ExbD/TolR family protein n=1 Tax=unclassified Oleiphilus TaxID=2631174 RepID=UPI0007C38BF4|nr:MULTISPECIES: biopolymer transporter ExbD [unclassified Oleiphilus]KZY62115.1 biopolymer transporter ExbD [Oleiphilus sp. HI0066]KZY63889.1 biopolymer transporter ExbD [Oleiphilus sp. HI0066]KZY72062.1 biopolymer transporter ExbD [Oleiphilus sp. HI0067]